MLYILFGATAEMGKWSREYLQSKGLELIQKTNFVPDGYIMQERFGINRKSSREEVLKCDFIYENNGKLVGFNKAQIIDAVRGRSQCLITSSGSTIDFIRQIKAAYGEYVTVIGTYIDDDTLERMFRAIPDITDEEVTLRIGVGSMIKRILLADRELFDHIVIYGGNHSIFNEDALRIQYDHIIRAANRAERALNDRMYVEMPYVGSENYLFVSYSHQDRDTVFPILRKMQLAGYRIWYDEGINGGENWRKILASKIQDANCREFLLFSSGHAVSSPHVRAEINLALDLNKKITTIRLDEHKFGPDIEMYLSLYQYLSTVDNAGFYDQLQKALDRSTKTSTD